MRQGFTLIELLIVMSVMAIASVSLVNSFNLSQDRIEFQQQANDISEAIASARASAISDDTNPEARRVSIIDLSRDEITSFVDGNGDGDLNEGETLIKRVNFNSVIDISEVEVVVGTDDTAPEAGSKIRIYFNPVTNSCDFSVVESGDTTPEELMLVLHLGRPPVEGDTGEILRYVYLHKKSCIPELLSTPPTS